MDRQTSNLAICSLSAGRTQHNLYLCQERRENTWKDRQAMLLYVVCQQGAPSTTYIPARRKEKIQGQTDKQPGYTGWGGESWTIFCGPAAVAIGRCERKDQRNPLGSGLSYDGNIAAGTSGSAVAVEIACRRDTTQSSARTVKILGFSKASAIAKTWFSM